jgi:hypothetical protein
MTATREQQAEKIIRKIFQLGTGTKLELCLSENNLMYVKRWLPLTDAQLEALRFTDPNDATKQLSLKIGDYHEFQVFCIMVQHQRAQGKPANYLGIDITVDEFDDFDGSNECLKLMMVAQPMPTFAQPPPNRVGNVPKRDQTGCFPVPRYQTGHGMGQLESVNCFIGQSPSDRTGTGLDLHTNTY